MSTTVVWLACRGQIWDKHRGTMRDIPGQIWVQLGQQNRRNGAEARNEKTGQVAGFIRVLLVGGTGIEPVTPAV